MKQNFHNIIVIALCTASFLFMQSAYAAPKTIILKPKSANPKNNDNPGGYYSDDGPHDDAPIIDLLSIQDPEPKWEILNPYANRPYTVMGNTFFPMKADEYYKASGHASWYGKKFQGRKTASGEIYDMYALSAAHPTLPIPSFAKITNLSNNETVVVRVNDRGPFFPNRLIDVSYAAALKLGLMDQGGGQVEVERIFPSTPIPDNLAKNIKKPGTDEMALANLRRWGDLTEVTQIPETAAEISDKTKDAETSKRVVEISAVKEFSGSLDNSAKQEKSVKVINPSKAPIATATKSVGVSNKKKSPQFFIQVAALKNHNNAKNLVEQTLNQLNWESERGVIKEEQGLYKVRFGPYDNRLKAQEDASRFAEAIKMKPIVIANGHL